MAKKEFDYKGKHIVIEEDHPNAVVRIDNREFIAHHHHPDDDQGLAMWMSDEAFFATPDIQELARHFADYLYMFDDPNRILVDDEGNVIEKPKHHDPHGDDDDEPGSSGHHNHDTGGGGN